MRKNIKLIYNDVALDKKINDIRKAVTIHMNGATVHSMQEMGLKYEHNYGVSIPDLRTIARKVQKSKDLAIRLRQMKIREMKILSTMLFPAGELDWQTADIWQSDCNNIELTEQAVMNLFQHWNNAVEYSLECLKSSNKSRQIFGLLLAQRTYTRFDADQTGLITGLAFELLHQTTDITMARYIGAALAAFCRKNDEIAIKLKNKVTHLNISDKLTYQIVVQLITQEMDFLGIN